MELIDRKIFYNTVLSQVISSCQKYLFVGTSFGDIFIFSTKDITAVTNENDFRRNAENIKIVEPILVFKISKTDPINSLEFNGDFLIVGTIGLINGYKWNEQKIELTKNWTIKLKTDKVENSDINFLLVDKKNNCFYAGCGNNIIYSINLEDRNIIREFKGHKNYIHYLANLNYNIYSASEDGSILIWDIRDQKSVGKIEPYKHDNIIRPQYGKWQGTVSVTNDWLLCGGGPKASMWHTRSMECTNVLPFPTKIYCSKFVDDVMIVAGEYQSVQQYSFNGDKVADIPISGAAVYSIVCQEEPYKFMSIAGASNALDICTNFNYRDMVVKLYKK